MRSSISMLFAFFIVLLFSSQVLASPIIEARQNTTASSTSSQSSSSTSSPGSTATGSGYPNGVGTGSTGSGEGSSGQNTRSDAMLSFGVPVSMGSALVVLGVGFVVGL